MSTFQREVQTPLNKIASQIEESKVKQLPVNQLQTLMQELNEVKNKLEQFLSRADKPDSPYGDNMKQKIRAAGESVDLLAQSLQIASTQTGPPTTPHEVVSVSAKEDPPSVPNQLAAKGPETSENLSDPRVRIAEAAKRLKEKEDELQAQQRARQLILADEERQRRQILRERDAQEAKRIQQDKQRDTQLFNSLITLGTVNHVNGTADFHAKVNAARNRACVVDWYAPWCGPCRMMAPVFQRLAQEHQEVVFLTVDTELSQNKPLAQASNIRALPTFEVSARGKSLKRIEGANVGTLEQAISEATQLVESALVEETLRLSALQDFGVEEATDYVHHSTSFHEPVLSQGEILVAFSGVKGRILRSVAVSPALTVSALYQVAQNALASEVALILWRGFALDSRRKDFSLSDLGFSSKANVRVVTKTPPCTVRLKIGERISVIPLRPTALLARLRAQARNLSLSSEPRLIYLGRIFSTEQDCMSLQALKITSDSTILCQPAGSSWDPSASTAFSFNSGHVSNADPGADLYLPEEPAFLLSSGRDAASALQFIDTSSAPLWRAAETKFFNGLPVTEEQRLAVLAMIPRSCLRKAAQDGKMPIAEG